MGLWVSFQFKAASNSIEISLFGYAIDQEDQEEKTLFGQRRESLFVLLLVAPVFYITVTSWVLVQHQPSPTPPNSAAGAVSILS